MPQTLPTKQILQTSGFKKVTSDRDIEFIVNDSDLKGEDLRKNTLAEIEKEFKDNRDDIILEKAQHSLHPKESKRPLIISKEAMEAVEKDIADVSGNEIVILPEYSRNENTEE